MSDASPVEIVIGRLVARLGKKRAHQALDLILDELTVAELAALAYDWRHVWARPKQLAPDGPWRSWGFLCGRGFGKTRSVAEHINEEVEAGRAMRISLSAQNEAKSLEIQVFGESGLIATAPPWFRPEWIATTGQLVWPNEARAAVLTPEAPASFRGPEFHLSWATEFQSWPTATRFEAYTNMLFATRLGYSRLIWDATPKKGHPILLDRLKLAKADPARHLIVRGTTRENAANLGAGVIDDLETQFLGTSKGREELLGEMLEESENALVKLEWIEKHRRARPDVIVRRVLSIDPAVTTRAGNDRTGIIDDALGADGQVYVMGDHSGRHEPAAWARIVIDTYVGERIDVVVVETNKGGQLVTQNLRAAAADRKLTVVVVNADEHPSHQPGVIYVKEVHARGPKEDRAQPLATAYERGRVSHVRGVDLAALEDTLTTWEPAPGQRSPDALDAHVHGVVELLRLASNAPDMAAAFHGITEMQRELAGASSPGTSISRMLGGGRGGDRL